MSFSFGETNRPESNPYPENLFLRGSLAEAARRRAGYSRRAGAEPLPPCPFPGLERERMD